MRQLCSSYLKLFCGALLLAAAAAICGCSVAFAADSGVGSSFTSGNCTYTVIAASDGSDEPMARLTGVERDAASVTVPARVTSPTDGTSYRVTSINFGSFNNHGNLVRVELPASVTGVLSGSDGAYFAGCDKLAHIAVAGSSDDGMLAADDDVLYALNDGRKATLLAYPRQKTDANFTVPSDVSTVAAHAFAGNEHLTQVTFQSGLEGEQDRASSTVYAGGIRPSAFADCTALESVAFPDGAKLGTVLTSASPAIGSNAFKGCTSLKQLRIPAIISAAQKATSYASFSELNPGSNLSVGTDETFTSGYAPYWHNGNGPVARAGIGDGAFAGCTALESVAFEAGTSTGAFAYWVSGSNVFKDCTALKRIIYESTQAYWGNPNTSMQNGTFTDIWDEDHNAIDAPTLYYAVDYYATHDAAQADNAAGDKRLTRVAFERGTSTAAIATSSTDAADHTAARALYAQTAADGTIPDPDKAAAEAGLSGTGWVWKLDGTQSRRAGLTESCRAYLVKADTLSAGRIEAAPVAALYLQADRNLSEPTGLCPDSAFDVERYSTDNTYRLTPLAREVSPLFTYNPTTGQLNQPLQVVAADGTALDVDRYTVSYQRYNTASQKLEDVDRITSGGAYLLTVTPTDDGFTGTLAEWIVVEQRTGNLVEAFGNLSATEHAAKYPYSQTSSLGYDDAPFAVTVGTNDVCGALVASSYAGLVQGAINVDTAQTAKKYGFALNRSIYPDGSVRDASQTRTFKRTGSASAFAVAVYRHFQDASNRRTYGVASEAYAWGDTAVLVPLGHVADVASICAYAYAMKAPVFFTELDGSCSKATVKALKDFNRVKVAGSTTLYSAKRLDALKARLGDGVTLQRIGGTARNRGAFSLAVADELVSEGKAAYSVATVSSSRNAIDVVLALNFSGHEGGVTLVTGSTAQSKQIMRRLHTQSDTLTQVDLYGRAKNNAAIVSSKAADGNAFGSLWDSDEDFAQVLAGVTTTVANRNFSATAVDPDATSTKKKATTHKKKATKSTTAHTVSSAHKHAHKKSTGASTASALSVQAATARSTASASSASATTATQSTKTAGKASHKKTTAKKKAKAKTAASKSKTKGKAVADKSTAAASDTATTAGDTVESSPELGDTTPLWQKALFIAVLLMLCGALIPILRKCR